MAATDAVSQLLKAAGSVIQHLLSIGRSVASIILKLARDYPGFAQRTYQGAIARFDQARQVGESILSAFPGYEPPESSIPINPSIANNYRYTVLVDYIDPVDGLQKFRWSVVDSPYQLSAGIIKDAALQSLIFSGGKTGGPDGMRAYAALRPENVQISEIRSVFRKG